jgi:transcriptional regulator with XRE-family HTH domain
VAVTVSIDQLGAELRRRRAEEELSLREVESATQISAATLSRIERGSVPDVSVLGRLAEWLDVNICAAGEESSSIRTDEDLKRTIAVHLRANKKLPEPVARAIVESFELVMKVELQRARQQSSSRNIA